MFGMSIFKTGLWWLSHKESLSCWCFIWSFWAKESAVENQGSCQEIRWFHHIPSLVWQYFHGRPLTANVPTNHPLHVGCVSKFRKAPTAILGHITPASSGQIFPFNWLWSHDSYFFPTGVPWWSGSLVEWDVPSTCFGSKWRSSKSSPVSLAASALLPWASPSLPRQRSPIASPPETHQIPSREM